MKSIIIFLITSSCVATLFAQPKIYNITTYGARPDAISTTAVQDAIDAAAKNGGGKVVVPKGVFVIGTIELKSNVELHFNEGGMLLGSSMRKDYDGYSHLALVLAVKQHNISITGKGVLDGNGRALMKDIFKRLENGTLTDPEWKVKRPGEASRTSLIYFEDCDNIKVTDAFFKDATTWVTHYERCKNVTINNIRLESMAYWNNDGIDIVDCQNFKITNSFISSADDAICLKSGSRNHFCDSILVENCTLRSSANAFKLGTSSWGGFKNITVRNIKVFDTYRSAIALEAVDGGFLENIDIRNVLATNTGNAVFIKLGHRNKDEVYSVVKNIYIGNVKVEVPAGKPDAGYEMEGPLLKYPRGVVPQKDKLISVSPWNHSSPDSTAIIYKHNVFPSSISGLPGHAVENVTLENIEISYAGGGSKEVNYFPVDSFQLITEAEKDYPEFSMFGEVPAWGFYVRHVKGLTLKNIKLTNARKDYRTAVLVNDGEDVNLQQMKIAGPVAMPVLYFNDVKKLQLGKVKNPGKSDEATKITGAQ